MKKLFSFFAFLIINISGNSQVFNKVYPSIRPELLTVDGLTFTIPLPNNEAYFLTYSIPLLGPYYSYMIATRWTKTETFYGLNTYQILWDIFFLDISNLYQIIEL
ncbi:MAG: hypothetical protein IPI50_14760 [Saprospiraceae bacterium]|nr:hypothetical protein [Saprospiraceae bacterium]